jgi:hypothetical protein
MHARGLLGFSTHLIPLLSQVVHGRGVLHLSLYRLQASQAMPMRFRTDPRSFGGEALESFLP